MGGGVFFFGGVESLVGRLLIADSQVRCAVGADMEGKVKEKIITQTRVSDVLTGARSGAQEVTNIRSGKQNRAVGYPGWTVIRL